MNVSYRVISASELDAGLIENWHTIQSRNPVFASPYFRPEFTQLVGNVRNDVRIAIIENNGRIAGFFPFQRSRLGAGTPVAGPLSDYHGVIAPPDAAWNIHPLMQAAKLSTWNFNHLVDATGRFEPHVVSRTSSPQIDLSAGYEQYAQARREAGSDYIKKTEGLARKLGRDVGEVQFSLHEAGDAPINQLIQWKSAQYRSSKLPDAFSVRWTGDLLRRISRTQAASFAGVCSVLRVNEKIIAVHLGMRSASVLHYWFPVYDPAFAKFSAGIILLLRMAEALAGTGVKIIDLGQGISQYKQRLMTNEVAMSTGCVELPSLLAAARRAQRLAEIKAGGKGIAALLNLPLKAIRRIERTRKYR